MKIQDPERGKVYNAGLLYYLHKPSCWNDVVEPDEAELIARAKTAIKRWWRDQRPTHAIVTDDYAPAQAGDTVLSWGDDRDFVRDAPDWEGLSVGVLVPLPSNVEGAKFAIRTHDDYTAWMRGKTLKGVTFNTVWGWYINALEEMKLFPDGKARWIRRWAYQGRPAQDLGTTKEWLAALRGRLRALDHEVDPGFEGQIPHHEKEKADG